MSRDGTCKPADAKILTVPLTPELHKKLRVRAAQEGQTIKWLLTELIEHYLKTPVGGDFE